MRCHGLLTLTALALLLTPVTADGARTSKNEDGTVIVVQPEDGDTTVVLHGTQQIVLPEYTRHYWLVHPEAMENCMARVAALEPYQAAAADLERAATICETQRSEAAKKCNDLRDDYLRTDEALSECRRGRWRNFFQGSAAGAALASTVFVLILLL
jgi:hypothetical protein